MLATGLGGIGGALFLFIFVTPRGEGASGGRLEGGPFLPAVVLLFCRVLCRGVLFHAFTL